jgi:glycogen operon protein
MFRYMKHLIAFRKAHPTLCRSRYWREEVRWYGVGQHVDMSYHSHTLAYCLRGGSVHDRDLYVMINFSSEPLDFTIQVGEPGQWKRAIDTGLPSPYDIAELGSELTVSSNRYRVQARSIVVLIG